MRKPLFIARQGRHPHGLLGRLVAHIMARETSAENKRAIELLGACDNDEILDAGTGHGASIAHLARLFPQAHITGVDNSAVMMKVAQRANRSFIRNGQVTLEQAGSEDLPFADDTFDKILSVHTLYFWDPIETHLAEFSRVLNASGRIVLGFRPAEDAAVVAKFPASVYRFRTTDEVTNLLESAGLSVREVARNDQAGQSMVWVVAENSASNCMRSASTPVL